MLKKLFFLGMLVATLQSVSAQEGWEAGGWAGIAYYFGDLNTSFDLTNPGLAGGLAARYNFNNRVCLRFGASYGQISATDADSDNLFEKARNLSFQSDVIDGSINLEFNFLPYIHGDKDLFFTPYLFAGFSAFYFNPKAELNGELYELRSLGTEGQFKGEEYVSVQGALTYGIGMKVDLSYRWSINVDVSGRKLFTDYLDDVSTVFPEKDDLEQLRGPIAVALSDRSIPVDGVINGEELGRPGRQRGNSEDKDAFVLVGVGLYYYFGDLKCPEYGRRR